jgi:S1-C subfamily serine protease
MPAPAAAALALAVALTGTRAGGAEIVLLDFWSPQCGPCVQMKPTIQNFKNAGYPIREIDVTSEPELARQHHVDRMPCFVMLVDDQEVDRVVGFTTGDRLQQMFKRAHDVALQIAERRRGQSPDPPRLERPTAGSLDSESELPSDAYASLLASSVRLRVDDANGRSYGTGTIIDARSGQALVITCGHLFRESQGKTPIVVELFEAAPGGVQAIGQVPAQLISYDLNRDVALVGIWPSRPVTVANIAPRDSKVERGMRVVSVGCSNGEDPTVLASRITSLDRYQGPPNVEASGAPVEGRSGGGLFNDKGELIGVCFAADYEGNEGLYAALESIHDELAKRGLSDISGSADSDASQPNNGQAANADTPIVRGQEPLAPVLPIPIGDADATALPPVGAAVAVEATAGAATIPAGLNAVEQAAWEEIMSRATTAEVICIIRPKEHGGQSEVITLDDVSPEFVRALAARQRAGEGTATR